MCRHMVIDQHSLYNACEPGPWIAGLRSYKLQSVVLAPRLAIMRCRDEAINRFVWQFPSSEAWKARSEVLK